MPQHYGEQPQDPQDPQLDAEAPLGDDVAETTPENPTDEIEALVGTMIDEAHDFIRTELAPLREQATKYYMGDKFGNEEEGRSQVVMTTVRDTVQALLPSLLRVFTGPEHYVEFEMFGPEDEPVARQQTDYVNYVVMNDNNGFALFHGVFKDALVRKLGVVKWLPEKKEQVEEAEYSGLTDEDLQVLLSDPEVDIDISNRTQLTPDAPPLYEARVRRTTRQVKIKVMACPGEEIAWNRGARSLEDARIVVHTRELPVSDLVAMGYDYDEVKEMAGPSEVHLDSEEDRARRFDSGSHIYGEDLQDETTRPIRYDEAYVYLEDPKRPGTAKLCKVCMIGNEHRMLPPYDQPQPVSHRPFALFMFDPEPHTIIGLSAADNTMDLQMIESSVMRGTLDSLSLALIPRTEIVDGMVNIQDLMNTEIGGVVRVRAPNQMREIAHRFVGDATLPILDRLQDIRENRTGISKAAAGLDADALQSATKAAVAATLSAAQQRLELTARIFAEIGMRQLYKGLLKTIVEHQDQPRVVRLRNQYVKVDPRAWNAERDVIINVGLGTGLTEEKIGTLREIAADQDRIYQALGPGNPLVTLRQLRNTRARLIELVGFRNPAEFYQEVSPEVEQQLAAAAAQPQQQQSDPATAAIAEAEKMKVQLKAVRDQAEIQLKRMELEMQERELAMRDDRERDKQAADVVLALTELDLKYSTSLDRAKIDAAIAAKRAELDADTRRDVARIQASATRAREREN